MDKKYKYPIYKRSKGNGFVVKFTSLSIGTVIKEGNKSSNTRKGYYSNGWFGHTLDNWEDYCIRPKYINDYKEMRHVW